QSSSSSALRHTAPRATHTPSLHDALPISEEADRVACLKAQDRAEVLAAQHREDQPQVHAVDQERLLAGDADRPRNQACGAVERRSEEHTSELQSRFDLVCRLLLEKTTNTP